MRANPIKKLMSQASIALVSILFLSCNMSASLMDIVSEPDFKKTDRFVFGAKPADGVEYEMVQWRFMNSDNSVVKGFTPELTDLNGEPIYDNYKCFESDDQGYSRCFFSASKVGQSTVRVQNIKTSVEEKRIRAAVEFTQMPVSDSVAGLTAGSHGFSSTTKDGVLHNYKVQGTVQWGSELATPTSPSGFVIYGQIEGLLTRE